MTHTTYTTIKTNNTASNNSANFSKILDDIILSDIIKKNSYLGIKKTPDTSNGFTYINKNADYSDILGIIDAGNKCDSSLLKAKANAFAKAANILANYNKPKINKLPYILGKTYYFGNTAVIFYDDEIQIGFDTYSYKDFDNILFLNALPKPTKKIIIDITIKINL